VALPADLSGEEWELQKELICEKPQDQWRINYDFPETLKTWADPDKLNLTCVSKAYVGSIGSAFFVGWALSAAIVPKLAKTFGKKIVILLSMLI
jgi:MFS family permease